MRWVFQDSTSFPINVPGLFVLAAGSPPSQVSSGRR